MAIFNLRTSILKAGKSAVAAAAYQSGSILHDEELNETFSYRHKEEVIHAEILLPPNAPEHLQDREALWNFVSHEAKSNERLARRFVFALPREWTTEECIDYTRDFLKKEITALGFGVDFAIHDSLGNPHAHVLVTNKAFAANGKFAQMEKKDYVLVNGERVPEIDENTGQQKVRIRTRNGYTSRELLWKRETKSTNPMNKRKFLSDIKHAWAAYCNERLAAEDHISADSYEDQGIIKLPMVHEGPGAKAALDRGIVFDTVKENQERKAINEKMIQLQRFGKKSKEILSGLKQRLDDWRRNYGQRNRVGTDSDSGRDGAAHRGVSANLAGTGESAGRQIRLEQLKSNAEDLIQRTEKARRRRGR